MLGVYIAVQDLCINMCWRKIDCVKEPQTPKSVRKKGNNTIFENKKAEVKSEKSGVKSEMQRKK